MVFDSWEAPNKGDIIIHSISQALQHILSRSSKRKPSHDALRYKDRVIKSTNDISNWDNRCLYWIIPGEIIKGWNLVCLLMGTFFCVFLNSRGGKKERLRPYRRVPTRVWWFFLYSQFPFFFLPSFPLLSQGTLRILYPWLSLQHFGFWSPRILSRHCGGSLVQPLLLKLLVLQGFSVMSR